MKNRLSRSVNAMNMELFSVIIYGLGRCPTTHWLQGAVFRRQELLQPVTLLHAALKQEL